MTSITQKINSVNGGISQQPDELKIPGQVVSAKNVFPDVTHGLQKRPGSQLVGSLSHNSTASLNSQTDGKWFSYYRDENEQYIGQISRSGDVNMWRCSTFTVGGVTYPAGEPVNVVPDSSVASQLSSYLTHTNDDDIQTLTLNDNTFINNRTEHTAMASTVEPAQPHQAFVELKQIKYASQYGLDLFNSTATNALVEVTTATRLNVTYHISNSPDPNNATNNDGTSTTYDLDVDGTCNSVGTQLFSVSSNATNAITRVAYTGSTISSGVFTNRGRDLIFRITTTGQPTTNGGAEPEYDCRYTVKIDLLHGGIGWKAGDKILVRMTNCHSATEYIVNVEESSTSQVAANLALVRPTPTPFDGESAVTGDMILGKLREGITGSADAVSGNGFVTEQIGNGIYITRPDAWLSTSSYSTNDFVSSTASNGGIAIYKATGSISSGGTAPSHLSGTTNNWQFFSASKFNVNTPVSELLTVLTTAVQDVADLPKQCKHNYIVKIRNSANDEDDYYVKFLANNGLSGEGVWEECNKPERKIEFDKSTMPIQLVRTSATQFTLSQIDYDNCEVGDPFTAPKPSFISTVAGQDEDTVTVNRTINKMIFFRNRLVFLSDENVIMSRPGDFFNFWPKSAIAASAEDPIDLSCSSEYPAIVYDGIQVNTGLVLFTKNQQFMLTTDSDVLSPLTAKINALATYNFNFKTSPISLGTTIAFLDNAGKFTRMFEMASVLREGEPVILEQSKVISKLFPKNINLVANSRENSFIVFAEKGGTSLYGFRYFTAGERRIMQSWITWELSGNIQHICMLDDAVYAVVRNGTTDVMQKFNLKLSGESTETITNDNKVYRVYLDNITSVTTAGNTYNSSNNKTTFPKPNGFDGTNQLVAYDIDAGNDLGSYTPITVNGSNLEITGNWSGQTFLIGYLYEMEVEFPKFYVTQQSGDKFISDVQSNLVIHRVKLNFGPLGAYDTKVKRVGKTDYDETHESTFADQYNANKLAIDTEQEVTVPIYERNKNYTLILKSSKPTPATLYSLAWEGDYSNAFYKRV